MLRFLALVSFGGATYLNAVRYERQTGRRLFGLPPLAWAVIGGVFPAAGLVLVFAKEGRPRLERLARIAGVAFFGPVGLMLIAVAYLAYVQPSSDPVVETLLVGVGIGFVAVSVALAVGFWRERQSAGPAGPPRSII